MPVTYQEASPDVYRLLKGVMREYFGSLTILDPDLRIKVLMATGKDIPCLKKGGCAVVADVKVVGAEERASNPDETPDVRFLVDRSTYDMSKEPRRRAMFARLLSYLDIKTHAHESADRLCCDLDAYNRPVVTLRPPDWRTEGFRQVVEWFGEDSWEHRELTVIVQDLGQDVFPWMKADDADESAVAARVEEIERDADAGAEGKIIPARPKRGRAAAQATA